MEKTQAINPSGTHLPYLSRLCSNTNGHIIELGSGYFSTPLLHWTTQHNGKIFRSYETNKNWADTMGEPVSYIENWEKANFFEMRWTIAFIDHGHALLRKEHAMALKDNADYIVLHDTEPKNEHIYRYSELWKHFLYRRDFNQIEPHTTIVSNTQQLDWL
jgi:hypothetical protein